MAITGRLMYTKPQECCVLVSRTTPSGEWKGTRLWTGRGAAAIKAAARRAYPDDKLQFSNCWWRTP